MSNSHSRLLPIRTLAASVVCALVLAACGDDDVVPPTDGGRTDMARVDMGPPRDMGPPVDMGPPRDMGPPVDMGATVDLGTPDLGSPVDGGPPPACAVPTFPALSTVEIGPGFDSPIAITYAPGDDGALYVAERSGFIQRVVGGTVNEFLDMSASIGSAPGGGDERGLLGLAFAPDYATSGRFFVGYTPTSFGADANIVAEYARSTTDPTVANPTQVARLVDQADPEGNHNGGWVGFGPDGFLYAAIGDGGGGGDGHGAYGNGLNTDTLLGKMLRLDIDAAGAGYAAAGNPFEAAGGLAQIWAYGLRNPWRNSFDRLTGDFYIADVGQNAWEEVKIVGTKHIADCLKCTWTTG